jgi:hypothetical protein
MDTVCTWAARDICAGAQLVQTPTNQAHPLRDRRATSNPMYSCTTHRVVQQALAAVARGACSSWRGAQGNFQPYVQLNDAPGRPAGPCSGGAWSVQFMARCTG